MNVEVSFGPGWGVWQGWALLAERVRIMLLCMVGKLLCRLGLHRWGDRFNDRGEHYRECNRCRKYREPPGRGGAAPFA
jgi:hypothetical protein